MSKARAAGVLGQMPSCEDQSVWICAVAYSPRARLLYKSLEGPQSIPWDDKFRANHPKVLAVPWSDPLNRRKVKGSKAVPVMISWLI